MPFLTDDYWQGGALPPPPMPTDNGSPLDTPDEILARDEAKRRARQDLQRMPYSTPFPPGSAQQQLKDWSAKGPPPLPKPKLWQRIAAGAVGAGAGYLNTTAGRPGGISQPIDARPAVDNIMGIPEYHRGLQNWQVQGQGLNTAAQQERYEQERMERGREADMRDQEARARIKEAEASSRALEEQRLETAARRKTQAAKDITENLSRYQPYDPTTELTPAPLQTNQQPPVPSTLQLGPPQAPDIADLPMAPRGRGMTVSTPPPSGFVAASRPAGGDVNKNYALPTLEQADRMKRGAKPVPADLREYLPVDEAPEAEILAAVKSRNADRQARQSAIEIADRQASNESARAKDQLERDKQLEQFRAGLQSSLLNAQDSRQARQIYSTAVQNTQKQAEAEKAKLDQEYGGYAQKNSASWLGQAILGNPAKGELSKAQQAERDRRAQEIEQRKQEALKIAEEAYAPYKNGAPGPPPSNVPPPRTPPPPPAPAPGAGRGGQSATVNVIAPDGTPGTIPRANLKKALAAGYTQAR